MKTEVWEILVPVFDNLGTRHSPEYHKTFDEFVISRCGGVTINRPAIGKWISFTNEYEEKESHTFEKRIYESMIPVKFCVSATTMAEIISIVTDIAEFTKEHYLQDTIMVYRISNKVIFI